MNGAQVREQMLSYLLNVIDQNSKTVEELQKQLAEANKKIADYEAKQPQPQAA